MLSHEDQELLTKLLNKEANGESLSAKERATQKKLNKLNKVSVETSELKANIFGNVDQGKIVSTYKIKPTSIRFVQAERDALARTINKLKTGSIDLIIERLGSVSQVNDTKLIRAAVLALEDMEPEQIIEYIKKAQRNMIGK
jgi:spore germination cell wall hydrolase CwlJ-like protein